MSLTITSIPLSSVELNIEWSLHPWNLDCIGKELEDSFVNLGILHPPVLKQKGPSFVPLAGYKRLQFLQSLHKNHDDTEIYCSVAAESTPVENILDIILCDQQSSSPLSLAEKAQFISIATRHFKASEIIDKYFDKLQLKKKLNTFNILTQLLQQDIAILKEADKNRLDENMIAHILQLKEPLDRINLVKLFKQLNLGGGKQKRFYTLIRDISRRSGATITDFLDSEEIVSILQHKEMNIPQTINNLGRSLEQLLTPNYITAQKDFKQKVNGLKLAPHYKITHSPSFEKDEVSLTLTFKNFEKCRQYLAADNRLWKNSKNKG